MTLIMTNNRTKSDERVCLQHVFHATSYASLIHRIFDKITKIGVWTPTLKQTMRFRGAILFCVIYLAVHDRSHTTTFTSGPQNTSTVAMTTMKTEI